MHFTFLEDQGKDRKCQHIIFVTKMSTTGRIKKYFFKGFSKAMIEQKKTYDLRNREKE